MKRILSALAVCAFAGAAQAGVVSGSGLLVNQDVDWYSFNNLAAGLVSISAVETVNDNSDFDSVLFLFRDDGNLTVDDFIAYDDDGAGGLQSRLDLNLAAGGYRVAVATHGAWYSPLPIFGGHHSGTDYTLTIHGFDVTGTVPEPASWALAGLALVAAGVSRKRKAG